jgi:site-specific DNA recombinase
MNKKAVKYLRFSTDEQSHFSIERQDMITSSWMGIHKIELVDTFVDKGFSATNFDRPDYKKLNAFIEKNYRNIDYLVVSDLTRFSREAGDAINTIKSIQHSFGIRIVSAGRGSVYDCTDHNSFFMMGLEFLLGNTENLKRINDINGGIYTAKAINQRYIGPRAPFGYRKEGKSPKVVLVIVEEQAAIIRWIYDSYLRGVPDYIIQSDVRDMGLKVRNKNLIKDILTSPIYSSQQFVKPWKDQPGGLYPLKDQEPIIDLITWNRVQERINRKVRTRFSIADEMPLRGVLKCHCGRLLTGAPSRNKMGKYFYYYKCQESKHNNISVIKSHDQLMEAFRYMSLTGSQIEKLTSKCEEILEAKMKDNSKLISQKNRELEKTETDLFSLEKKWIEERISFETYNRWFKDYTGKRNHLRAEIQKIEMAKDTAQIKVLKNVGILKDMRYVYSFSDTRAKHELIKTVFDNSLYYQQGIYRTPYLIPIFLDNALIMKEKGLLEVDKKGGNFAISSLSGGEENRTPVQTYS